MKVGDLVRHSMYAAAMPTALVVKIRAHPQGPPHHILILDQGDVYWDRMCEYEVISESR